MTHIYIYGSCFENQQGSGTVKVGGVQVPSYDVLIWTDYLIEIVLPFEAQTGAIEVDSQDDGSDSSSDWSGTLTVYAPSHPAFYDTVSGQSKVDPAGPSALQWVQGTWNYYAPWSGEADQYSLSGSSSIQGTYNSWVNTGSPCSDPIYGNLYVRGITALALDPTDFDANPDANGCHYYGETFGILNSGDSTTLGCWWSQDNDFVTGFPASLPNDGSCLWDAPLFKSATDIPTAESPQFLGWVRVGTSPDPTYAAWQRTIPSLFSGRFVFEQNVPDGGNVDGCYDASNGTSPFPADLGVTGGGWYVNSSGVWGSGNTPSGLNLLASDDIGIDSRWVQWYQQNVGQCSIIIQQAMFIDSIDGAIAYNTGGSYAATSQLEIDISNAPGYGVCTSITPNGEDQSSPACQDYR